MMTKSHERTKAPRPNGAADGTCNEPAARATGKRVHPNPFFETGHHDPVPQNSTSEQRTGTGTIENDPEDENHRFKRATPTNSACMTDTLTNPTAMYEQSRER
jgi:hypothetical protein